MKPDDFTITLKVICMRHKYKKGDVIKHKMAFVLKTLMPGIKPYMI